MSKIFFIRHAETALAGTFCGHSDPPLTARGHEQVATLIRNLGSQQFAKIYSSDLRRAQQTADLLATLSTSPVETRSALREIDFGDWDGLTWPEIEQRDRVYAQRWVADFPVLPAPGGEPYHLFKPRVLAEVSRILSLAGEQPFAVVTHAGALRVILEALFGRSGQRAWDLTKPYCAAFLYQGIGSHLELVQ